MDGWIRARYPACPCPRTLANALGISEQQLIRRAWALGVRRVRRPVRRRVV
jgi:hypothetical protein